MRRRHRATIAATLAGVLLLGACSGSAQHTDVTVFAAASLTEAFTAIAALDPTLGVTFSFDGSATLVDQLAAGAPADVLATADEATMARATSADLVEEPIILATNTMVLAVPAGNPAGITGLDASLDGARLVLCAPAVPCGATARRIADAAGVTLHPVSEEQRVTDVRGKVASGEADAGFVYRTDALAAGAALAVIEVPDAAAHASRYPIALASEAPNGDGGRAFIALATSEAGRAVLAEHGFTTP